MSPQTLSHREVSARRRLRNLQAVNRSIVGDLSLPGLLRRIVESAREVAGARSAALGIVGVDGVLEQFVHTGMDPDLVAALSDLPSSRGVPRAGAFLDVPIRSRKRVYGHLYLIDSDAGRFTGEDEELVTALAATAGIAIENARLHEESRMSQEWLRASGEISRQLLAFEDGHADVLLSIVQSMQRLALADTVSMMFPVPGNPDDLQIAITTGLGADQLTGYRYPKKNSLSWQVMNEGRGRIVNTVAERPSFKRVGSIVPITQVMAVPLQGVGGPRGAVVIGRVSSQVPFTQSSLDMAEAFAVQAAIVLGLADSRADRHRLALLEDRDRIARDLHDHVIQRLFAAGMSLESMAGMISDASVRTRLARTVDDLDNTIRQIRSSIFALQDSRPEAASIRSTVMTVVDQVSPLLGFRPRTRLNGPMDTVANEEVAADVEAVLRESLTNVAKHAQASSVQIEVTAFGDQLRVVIIDDGVGLSPTDRRSGLRNLQHRAERWGGTLTLTNPPEGGLRVEWLVPLAP